MEKAGKTSASERPPGKKRTPKLILGEDDLRFPYGRLKSLVMERFESGKVAARSIGVNEETFSQHLNGYRGLTARAGRRYAEFFRVNFEWLMTGRGPIRGARYGIPIVGLVGAGATVLPIDDQAYADAPYEVNLPEREKMQGLRVVGDSMEPRFIEGEVVLFDPQHTEPETLRNDYVVADMADGRRLVKKLERSKRIGEWDLVSLNAPREVNAHIIVLHRIFGSLSRSWSHF